MRKLLFATLCAIIPVSVFLTVNRGHQVSLEDLAPVQQNQRTTANYDSLQPIDVPGRYAESDDLVFDEEVAVINWYAPQHHELIHPEGTPLENYNYYKSLSESGFALASYQLALMMDRCRNAFLTREDLEEAILKMNSTFTLVLPNNRNALQISNPEGWVKGAAEDFEYCEDFTADQRDESQMWLEIAANQGYTQAMIRYGAMRHKQGSDAQVQLYEAAWRLGNVDALQWLAGGLMHRYDQGVDPTARVPAYAAMHAFVTLLRSAPEIDHAEAMRSREYVVSRMQARLDEIALVLTPSEIGAAENKSAELIEENGNCCFSTLLGLGIGL